MSKKVCGEVKTTRSGILGGGEREISINSKSVIQWLWLSFYFLVDFQAADKWC